VRKYSGVIFLVLVLLAVLCGWILLFKEKRECTTRGGVYLKTLVIYECVMLREK
jgi:uncharacterized iron-regulated membrane protein